jgi:phospholipid/cholesterol/gamma-HCH transport system substrate-binding protein
VTAGPATVVRRMGRLVAALAAVLSVGGLAACSDSGAITLTAHFDDVGDLVTGHAVQMADVRVGRITGIRLTDDFRAEVTLEVDGDVPVPAGTRALMRTTSLLGEKFVELRYEGERGDGPFLGDGDEITDTAQAPELEFVAEQLVKVLGGIVADDLATMIETGAVGFGGRAVELRALIDDLSVISGTLAERTGQITSIIDRLDSATSTLAAGAPDLDALLVNLADTTRILAENRDRAVTALAELSRLARVQNQTVFRPHLDAIVGQLAQVDAIVAEVARASGEVGALLDWLDRFAVGVQTGIPGDFAQVYGWFVFDDEEGGGL